MFLSEFNQYLSLYEFESRRGSYRDRRRYLTRRPRGRGNHNSRPERNVHADLIEPNKVFIANISERVRDSDLRSAFSQYGTVEEVKIIRRQPGTGKVFAFVTFLTEEDVKKVLSLNGTLRIGNDNVVIKPAIKQLKIPGDFGYVRKALDDREFDLEPSDSEIPSAHVLNDDVILKIFDCLPLKKLISIERVCRRWQHLVHSCFRQKATLEIQTNISSFIYKNGLPRTPAVFSKFLYICGQQVTRLNIEFFQIPNIFRIIGQLCPNLESFRMTKQGPLNYNFVEEFALSCQKLTEFRFTEIENFGNRCDDKLMTMLLKAIPNLQILEFNGVSKIEDALTILPPALKELHLIRCRIPSLALDPIVNCEQLEVLTLDGPGTSGVFLTELGKNCPNLKELVARINGNFAEADLTLMKNLKKLGLKGLYSVNSVIQQQPELETLVINDTISESPMTLIDFSPLTKLKVLRISSCKSSFSPKSLQTIPMCKSLETFELMRHSDCKEVILSCIKKCPSLKKVECKSMYLVADDISRFVEANRRRSHTLKLIIGLDSTAMDQIEKLAEGNYDIDMIDTDNLFRDSEFDFDEYWDSDEDDFCNDWDDMDSLPSDEDMDFALEQALVNFNEMVCWSGLY